MSILAQIFDDHNSIKNLEKFTSLNGSNHYGLSENKTKIKLLKRENPIVFKKQIKVGIDSISVFNPNFPVYWDVV